MGFLQDADQFVGCLAPLRERAELLEDVLDQLHIVLPHSLKLGFLKSLMGLGFNKYKTDVTLGYVFHHKYHPITLSELMAYKFRYL